MCALWDKFCGGTRSPGMLKELLARIAEAVTRMVVKRSLWIETLCLGVSVLATQQSTRHKRPMALMAGGSVQTG
jgi:hypothetical protein